MNMEFIRKLPIPKELKAQFSLSEKLISVKEKRDAEIKKVFTGESDKKLLIIGPCSADREDAVLDYVNRLAKVQEKIADKLILIPRIYTNKPRTTGTVGILPQAVSFVKNFFRHSSHFLKPFVVRRLYRRLI